MSENGNLNNAIAGGWLDKQEWDTPETNNFEYELCNTHCLVASSAENFLEERLE